MSCLSRLRAIMVTIANYLVKYPRLPRCIDEGDGGETGLGCVLPSKKTMNSLVACIDGYTIIL